MGFKLAETNGLREACDSKELWKTVEKIKSPTVNRFKNARLECAEPFLRGVCEWWR